MAYLIEGPVIVHACPSGDAPLTPCCGRNPHDLPRGHRIARDPALVTCELTPAQRVAYRNRAVVDIAARLTPGPTHQAPTEPPAAAALADAHRPPDSTRRCPKHRIRLTPDEHTTPMAGVR